MKTGKLLERAPKEETQPPEKPESDADILRKSKDLSDPVKLKVDNGLWLSHKLAAKPDIEPFDEELVASVFEYRLFQTDDEGRVKWKFDLEATGYEIRYCPYSEKSRYSPPYIYLIACEKRTTKIWKKIEVYNPTQFHLLTLDLSSGCVIQDIQVTKNPVDVCRFEDMDENGVLISDSERTLWYFEKSSECKTATRCAP